MILDDTASRHFSTQPSFCPRCSCLPHKSYLDLDCISEVFKNRILDRGNPRNDRWGAAPYCLTKKRENHYFRQVYWDASLRCAITGYCVEINQRENDEILGGGAGLIPDYHPLTRPANLHLYKAVEPFFYLAAADYLRTGSWSQSTSVLGTQRRVRAIGKTFSLIQ